MRLIDADLLLAVVQMVRSNFPIPDNEGVLRKYLDWDGVKYLIERATTIDAVPVVHARVVWKNRFMGGFEHGITITDRAGEKHTGTLDTTHYEPVPYCSECGKELGVSSLAYCPNCGAKMDGGAEA